MAVYGDSDQIKTMLRADESIPFGADIDSRIDALNSAISLAIDEDTGRVFGTAATVTDELHWIGPYSTIVLNRPATAVTSITYGGTLSGSTMTGGTTVLAADLANLITTSDGLIYAVSPVTGGIWSWYDYPSSYQTATLTPVVVTATYDDATDPVPADIVYIANYMIAERLKVEKAGPAGFTGPAGDIVPVRDVFSDPLVKRVLRKYRVVNRALVV